MSKVDQSQNRKPSKKASITPKLIIACTSNFILYNVFLRVACIPVCNAAFGENYLKAWLLKLCLKTIQTKQTKSVEAVVFNSPVGIKNCTRLKC